MKIGILGSGVVAKTLGAGLQRKGHAVMLGTSDPAKLATWVAGAGGVRVASFAEAAAFADLAILAVKGSASVAVVNAAGAQALAGKTVIDAGNPIADGPPVHGVLPFFTGPNESLLETLQAAFPAVHFVKAFNSIGSAHMIDPKFAGGPPTMFIAGNDAAARAEVTALVRQLGWECADMGFAEAARAIEPLCMLWCIPGILHNQWGHAFRLLEQH
jgi:hypothetical protein